MRWEDERYVRLFTRDAPSWLTLSFDAQALLMHLLRKVDRAGILPLGKLGPKGVAVAIGHPQLWDRLQPALNELLEDGCVRLSGEQLLVPNFLEAQECAMSNAARKRTSRERARALLETVTKRDRRSRKVTVGTVRYGSVRKARKGSVRDGTEAKMGPGGHEPLRALWNQIAGESNGRWKEPTGPTRQDLAAKALERRPLEGENGWRAVFTRAAATPFLHGRNERGWVAGPDFVLRGTSKGKQESAARILAGEFDEQRSIPGNGAHPQVLRELKPGEDPYAD